MTILPSYYNTFVDVMEFHEVALEVITSLATVQFNFEIVSFIDLMFVMYTCVAIFAYFARHAYCFHNT